MVFKIENINKKALEIRAINHEVRLKIIRSLAVGKKNVTDITALLKVPQPVASQHLAILRKNGLVSIKKDGKNVYYSNTVKVRKYAE